MDDGRGSTWDSKAARGVDLEERVPALGGLSARPSLSPPPRVWGRGKGTRRWHLPFDLLGAAGRG